MARRPATPAILKGAILIAVLDPTAAAVDGRCRRSSHDLCEDAAHRAQCRHSRLLMPPLRASLRFAKSSSRAITAYGDTQQPIAAAEFLHLRPIFRARLCSSLSLAAREFVFLYFPSSLTVRVVARSIFLNLALDK